MSLPTVAPDDQVESENHNSIVGLLNGTPGFGQPVKLYDYNNSSTYSLTVGNQDTDNGLIAKFQYGPVGAATEVVRITKAGIFGVIHNLGQNSFELESFAATVGANIRGTSPSEDPDVAWAAAFAAVTAAGGGTILLGPYTYLAPTSSVTWVANCILRGAGMFATTIYHRDSSAREPVRFLNLAGCGVIDLAVNGNYSNNKSFASSEVTVDGDNSFAHRVRVFNYNFWGIECGGLDTVVSECHLIGNAPGSYTAFPTADQDSLWGIVTASTQVCKRIRILGNRVTGHRSGAIVAGGIGTVVANNTVEDNHRGDLGFSPGTGGGQIALVFTKTTVSADTQPQHCIIANNTVGPMPTVIGVGGAIGIECNSWKNCLVIGNTVNNVSEIGISFSASAAASSGCQLIGNTVHSVDTHNATVAGGGSIGVTVDANGFDISGLLIEGMTISNCRNMLYTNETGGGSGVVTGLNMQNWTLIANTAGWTNNMATSVYGSGGHQYLSTSHAPLPEYTYHNWATGDYNAYETYAGVYVNTGSGSNSSNTANGLLVVAGSIATDYPLRVATTGAVDRLTVRGNGDVVMGSAALATNATTGGWFWMETCAGTPTGVPATLYTGRVPFIYDTTNNKIYVYNGAWKATGALT